MRVGTLQTQLGGLWIALVMALLGCQPADDDGTDGSPSEPSDSSDVSDTSDATDGSD